MWGEIFEKSLIELCWSGLLSWILKVHSRLTTNQTIVLWGWADTFFSWILFDWHFATNPWNSLAPEIQFPNNFHSQISHDYYVLRKNSKLRRGLSLSILSFCFWVLIRLFKKWHHSDSIIMFILINLYYAYLHQH